MAQMNFSVIGRLGAAFTPTRPISSQDLLSGRLNLLVRLQKDVFTPGQHVLLYGNRGVGKSSIARVLALLAQDPDDTRGRRCIFVSCDSIDTFGSIWRKIFQEILIAERQIGFEAYQKWSIVGRWNTDDEINSPNDVRLLISGLPNHLTVIIDEFDRIEHDSMASLLMTDTIKLFSDTNTPCSIVLVGAGQSIESLTAAHESVSRNLDYVLVDPMEPGELAGIIKTGFQMVGMDYENGLDMRIAQLSQGYPHYTHLLGQQAGLKAAERGAEKVTGEDLQRAIPESIENAAGGIRVEYDRATDSTQPNNLFKQVLLSCALAEKDIRGRFPLSAIEGPLQRILGKKTSRTSYQRHLAAFCHTDRGPVLSKTGRPKNYRWHFTNPQLIPFVRLHGINGNLITEQALSD